MHQSLLRFVLTVLACGVLASTQAQPEAERHWAFRAPARVPVPNVVEGELCRNPIDCFLNPAAYGARLATKEQLIRRVTLDLIGLPPTPAEIDAFVNDSEPAAWERLIDRLLASPHYGERWGRHWLDLARYADSNGYEFDELRPDAWRYRDYVIRSFNADKAYDRFLKEQLAGDELYPDDRDALIATGFNLHGPDMTDSSDQPQRRQNTLNDMTDTAGLVFLGLTIACARCHDHKFDPIPQTDYYRLQAFFTPTEFRHDLRVFDSPAERRAYEEAERKHRELVKPLEDALRALEAPYRARLREQKLPKIADEAQEAHKTPEDKRTPRQKDLAEKTERFLTVSAQEVQKALSAEDRQRHAELEGKFKSMDRQRPPAAPKAMGLQAKKGVPPKTVLLERGELSSPGEEVHAGFPIALQALPLQKESLVHRRQLAAWLVEPGNPLTARVLVNRLWQYHFGKGLVATASDYGLKGTPPSHPELLDWLAKELVASGWSMKRMHRLMLTSGYYQSTASRKRPLRLEGEVIRDSLLAVSGRLSSQMAGSPSPPSAGERRSIYLLQRRNLRLPFLEAFDLPDSNLSCPKRERSTTAPQALALLNSAEVSAAAKALAERIKCEAATDEEQIVLAYRLTLGRRPTKTEANLASAFLRESPMHEFCRALFNLNEFVYVE